MIRVLPKYHNQPVCSVLDSPEISPLHTWPSVDASKVTAKLSAARISLRKPILPLSSKMRALQMMWPATGRNIQQAGSYRTLKNKNCKASCWKCPLGNTKVEEKHWSFPKMGCSACKTTFFSLKAFFCNFTASDDWKWNIQQVSTKIL